MNILKALVLSIVLATMVGCSAIPTFPCSKAGQERARNYVAGVAETGVVGSRQEYARASHAGMWNSCNFVTTASSRSEFRNGQPHQPQPMVAPLPQHFQQQQQFQQFPQQEQYFQHQGYPDGGYRRDYPGGPRAQVNGPVYPPVQYQNSVERVLQSGRRPVWR